MFALDLFQNAALAIVVAIAWSIAAWIGGAILAGWVASQAGREPVLWLALALVLSPVLALIALAGLPSAAARSEEEPRALGQERRLKAVSSL